MIKIVSIIFVSSAVSLYGMFAASSIRKAANQRKGLIELLYAIKSGIEYTGEDLCEIYRTFNNTYLEECGFCTILKSNSADSLRLALESGCLKIGETEKVLFYEFSKKCGRSAFATSEKQLCDRYIALSEALDKKLSVKENSKCELYRRLGVLCGLLTAILMM